MKNEFEYVTMVKQEVKSPEDLLEEVKLFEINKLLDKMEIVLLNLKEFNKSLNDKIQK